MLALCGVVSLTGGTCVACNAPQTRYERVLDVLGAGMLVLGLSLVAVGMPH